MEEHIRAEANVAVLLVCSTVLTVKLIDGGHMTKHVKNPAVWSEYSALVIHSCVSLQKSLLLRPQ